MRDDESAASTNFPLLEDHQFFPFKARTSRTRRNDITSKCTNIAAFECVDMDGLLPYVQTFCRPRLDACGYIRTRLTIGIHSTTFCLTVAAVFGNSVLGPWAHILWSTIAVSRHCRYNTSFSARLDLLSCHEYFPIWLSLPRDVRLMTSAVTRFYDVCADGFDVS